MAVHHDAILSRALRGVHIRVGSGDHLLWRLDELIGGYANAQRDPQASLNARPVKAFDPRSEVFADCKGLRLSGLRQHQDEFLATVARRQIRDPRGIADQPSDLDQHLVADLMREPIIDVFEIVNVHHRQRQRLARALRFTERGCQ